MSSTKFLVLIALSFAACGGSKQNLRVEDARLVRLSPEARQDIIDQEREARVAEANRDAARVAENEAKQFESIVGNERKAAKERLEGAKKSVTLGAGAGVPPADAQARRAAAESHMASVEAKAAYAKDLVAYRSAVVAQREAEVASANADLERAKVDRLTTEGQAAGFDRSKFERAATDARKRVVDRRAKAESRRAEAQKRRQAWQSAHSTDMARGETDTSTGDAPPPPTALDEPEPTTR